jgi:putative serine protease PepD
MSESNPNPAPRVRRPRATAEGTTPETGTPAAPRAPRAPRTAAPTTPPAPTTPLLATTPAPPAPPHAAQDAAPHTPAAAAPKRVGAGALVAVAAAAALVGGASGAGIAAWAVASNSATQNADAAQPQTITVNDPEDVNVVNAVAAKAGPSVVTVSVSSQSAAGTGSGVILSSDGYILTNNHVVTLDGASGSGTIEVTTADGHIYAAKIVGTDPIVDLAVIRLVDASGLTPIEFGDVDALDVGDRVVAIGAPLGLSNTVTDGIVSALNRSIQIASSAVPDDGTEDEQGGQGPFNFDIPGQQSAGGSGTISIPVIQTDAAINPGNSGGALVNDAGELVGINVAIASAGGANTTSGSIGVGFAIPADLAQRIAKELIDNGTATHGLLGATVRDASSADGSVVGAVIDSLTDGGAGAAAGLQEGDVVTDLGGTPITSSVDLTAQVRLHAAGDEVELTYVRDGQEHTVTVTLGEYTAQ